MKRTLARELKVLEIAEVKRETRLTKHVHDINLITSKKVPGPRNIFWPRLMLCLHEQFLQVWFIPIPLPLHTFFLFKPCTTVTVLVLLPSILLLLRFNAILYIIFILCIYIYIYKMYVCIYTRNIIEAQHTSELRLQIQGQLQMHW